MNKVLLGLILGAVLGAIDGATAWLTPEARTMMLGIIVGSTIKGIIAGVAAGWFARKVQNVWAGIVFGLVVGLILAYAVAAMQDKYYFEIMLPGGIVGLILGWATQQYGRPVRAATAAVMMMCVALFGVSASADDHDHAKPKSNAAFERLKSLAGKWNANALTPDGEKGTVEYRISSAGTVVMETMWPGTDHEMINMYTADGDGVVATHYCAAGNQPVLKMNAQKSTANELVFDFVSKSGAGGHYINGVRIRFGDDGKVVEEWSSSEGAEKMTLYLNSRAK